MNSGERIKQLREERRFTLEQVGNYLGVNKATVQRYESGNIDIKRNVAIKLAELFETTPSYIMCWENVPNIFTVAFNLNKKEIEIIEAYREQPHLHEAVQKVLGIYDDTEGIKDRSTAFKTAPDERNEITPDEYAEFMEDPEAFIQKHAEPYAARGGDASYLDDAQEDLDNSLKAKDGKENE